MAMQSGFIKRIRDIMRMDAGINGDAQRIEQMVWMLFLKVYDAKEDDWELNEDDYESIIPEELRWRNWAKADSNGHAMTGDKLLNFVNNILFPVLKGNDVKDGDAILYEGIKVTPDTPIKKAIVKSTFEDANNYMKDGVYLRQVIDVIDEIEFDDVKESHAFGFVYEEILRELQSAGSSGEFYTPRAVTEFMALMIKPQLGEKMADFACGTGGFITSWLGQLSKQVRDTTDQKQLDDSIYGVEKKPFPYLLCVTNIPPRVFKEMTRLTKQKSKLEDLLTGINPFNAKSRAEEICKILDTYIPSVEKMDTLLRKYGVAFTKTASENKKLKTKNAELEESLASAQKVSTLKQIEDLKLRRDYDSAVAILEQIPAEVLDFYKQPHKKERETAYDR